MLRSVRSRVVALAIGVATVAVGLTAWLTTRAAEDAIEDSAQRSLEQDAAIYQSLLDHGTTHTDWNGVEPLLADLADRYDRRVALADARGRLIADSDRAAGNRSRPLPSSPTVQLDPANPTLGVFGPGVETPAIDVDTDMLDVATTCLDRQGVAYEMVEMGGQVLPQYVEVGASSDDGGLDDYFTCTEAVFEAAFPADPTRDQTVDIYEQVLRTCLRDAGVEFIVDPDLGITVPAGTDGPDPIFDDCVSRAQRASVAPPALLYLGTGADVGTFGTGSSWRTIAIAGGVLTAAAAAAWTLGSRLTHPLTDLTVAAGRVEAGDFDHRVPAPGSGDLGSLARAFNAMASALQTNEVVRRQMVSDIAHELRNPLVTLHGTLEAIEDGVYQPDQAVLGSMREETAHLSALVRDLQELANADGGGLVLHRSPTDVVELARACVDAHGALAAAAGVTLAADIAAGPVTLDVDARRLRQVLDNLVSNAIRHTPAGGRVAVGVAPTRIWVADTGEGITADDLPRVFDRFWRADRSRARSTGGSGLGLAIAASLVAAHGASLEVESEPGEGSLFSVHGL